MFIFKYLYINVNNNNNVQINNVKYIKLIYKKIINYY